MSASPPQSQPESESTRRETLARFLFEKAMTGHAQWDEMTEPHKNDWRIKADAWIAADLKEKRAHRRKHPLPVTFE